MQSIFVNKIKLTFDSQNSIWEISKYLGTKHTTSPKKQQKKQKGKLGFLNWMKVKIHHTRILKDTTKAELKQKFIV